MAATDPARATIRTPARGLAQYVIVGPAIADVVRRHTAITGRTPLPPRWALGYHQSRWGYSPQSRLTDLARGFRDRGIGADGLWLDIQHLRGYRTFTWDPATFPDPRGLVDALAARGFALTVIADPGIKIDPGWDVYDSGVAGGHFLRDASGAVYQGVVWPGPSAFPDFTRAETRAWWGERVGALVTLGVRGIWLDVNEPTTFPEGGSGTSVPDELVTSTGATMAEVHNAYAVLEAQATWEGMRAAAPARRPFVLSRAGASGIQRWAAVWTGDAVSSWDGLGTTLPMLLGMGLSGVPFVGSDVGGYSGRATPELFARWMSLGAVSPFFRGHVTNGVNDQEPWAFGPEVEEISRRMIAERYRRMPYLYSLFAEAAASGAPVLRPMVYEFQDDPACADLDDQAMLGPSLLVAPVATAGATSRTVYLPAGRWIELASGAAYDGPTTIAVDLTLAALPTFLREGGIVPGETRLDVARGDGSFVLHEDAGDGYGETRHIRYAVSATATGTVITAEAAGGAYQPPPKDLEVRLRRVDQMPTAVRLDGAPVAFTWDARDLAVVVTLPHRASFRLEIDHDAALSAPRPPVTITVEVTVPAGTPGDIFVASSANGWTHQRLVRTGETARGELEVERGAWFFYKFTRGSWETVEKYADCGEVANRYRFGAAVTQVDAVARWRDDCE
jgi:alpha-glucosidase